MVIGTGCAIPGIMACRTIRNERERRATAMLAPFMPCGAKLPVIGLFVGAFFPEASWVGTAMYFVGILLILAGALLVNKITAYKIKNRGRNAENEELGHMRDQLIHANAAVGADAGQLAGVCQ